MTLITLDELARGTLLLTFGGLSGLVATVTAPGSALWLLPAAVGVAGGALTVPEVRQEVARALPALGERRRQLLASTAHLVRRPALAGGSPERAQGQEAAQEAGAPAGELVEALEGSPHRLIIGHTRGGKTTLIHHMATSWAARGERVLVGDPDAAPGLWPGCTVRGAGDDVESIGELLGIVAAEVEGRRLARAQGVRRFEPLHLVIDEAQDVLPALDGGLELFEDVARRGGKLNIRMTIGVQDKMVGTLGLKGKSEVLRNLQVADVLKNREGRRVAVLRDAETGQKVSMPIPQLTDPESLITVARSATTTTTDLRSMPAAAPSPALSPAAAPVTSADPTVSAMCLDLLDGLLAESLSSALGRSDRAATLSPVPDRTVDTDRGQSSLVREVVRVEGAGQGNTIVNLVDARPLVPALTLASRRRPRGQGVDARGRRRAAREREQLDRRAALATAYAEKKLAGWSYSRAYAVLKGNSDAAREAWRAAPGPAKKKGP